MSKFDAIAKMLGITAKKAEELAPEVVETLQKINTPEISTALKGVEREKYLKALDEAYGPVFERQKLTGHIKDSYHGSRNNFDEFKENKIGSSTDDGWLGRGYYGSTDPSVASVYAEGNSGVIYPLKLKLDSPYNFEGKNFYKEIQSSGGPKEFSENLKNQGFDGAELWSQQMVLNPNQIRSKFAAFDPRFKNSEKIMAGAVAVPAVQQMSEDQQNSDKLNIKNLIDKYEIKDSDYDTYESYEPLNVLADTVNPYLSPALKKQYEEFKKQNPKTAAILEKIGINENIQIPKVSVAERKENLNKLLDPEEMVLNMGMGSVAKSLVGGGLGKVKGSKITTPELAEDIMGKGAIHFSTQKPLGKEAINPKNIRQAAREFEEMGFEPRFTGGMYKGTPEGSLMIPGTDPEAISKALQLAKESGQESILVARPIEGPGKPNVQAEIHHLAGEKAGTIDYLPPGVTISDVKPAGENWSKINTQYGPRYLEYGTQQVPVVHYGPEGIDTLDISKMGTGVDARKFAKTGRPKTEFQSAYSTGSTPEYFFEGKQPYVANVTPSKMYDFDVDPLKLRELAKKSLFTPYTQNMTKEAMDLKKLADIGVDQADIARALAKEKGFEGGSWTMDPQRQVFETFSNLKLLPGAAAVPMGLSQIDQKSNKNTNNHMNMFTNLIHKVEGFDTEVYNDNKGNPTIGAGLNLNDATVRGIMRLSDIDPDAVIKGERKLAEKELDAIHEKYVQKREPVVKTKFGEELYDNLSPNQKAVILSLGYQSLNNLGPSLIGKISQDDVLGAMKEIILKTNKDKDPGILSRRLQEAEMFGGPTDFSAVFKIMTSEEKQQIKNILNKIKNPNTKKQLLAKYDPYLEQPQLHVNRLKKLFDIAER